MTRKELKFEGVAMVQNNHKKNGGRKLNSWEFGYRKDIFLTRVGKISMKYLERRKRQK